MLSMALWKAVPDHCDLLVATWDSGLAGKTELDRLAVLIWERLAPGAEAPAVSPPEACRLSDALAASLRKRLAGYPSGADVGDLGAADTPPERRSLPEGTS